MQNCLGNMTNPAGNKVFDISFSSIREIKLSLALPRPLMQNDPFTGGIGQHSWYCNTASGKTITITIYVVAWLHRPSPPSSFSSSFSRSRLGIRTRSRSLLRSLDRNRGSEHQTTPSVVIQKHHWLYSLHCLASKHIHRRRRESLSQMNNGWDTTRFG